MMQILQLFGKPAQCEIVSAQYFWDFITNKYIFMYI